jgi:hypothetical protein
MGEGELQFNHAAGVPPTGQGKQIETYLCAHVAVHGQPPAGLCIGWLAGWRVASEREPMDGAGGTLALARACSGAGAGPLGLLVLGFRRRPSNRGRLFCLPPCSRAVSGVDNELCYGWSHGLDSGAGTGAKKLS